MPELTTELRQLRELGREIGVELRSFALALDADPLDRTPLEASSALELLRAIATPSRFRDHDVPPFTRLYTESCLARTVTNVELARGDAGVMNACATPGLAGLTVDVLGSEAQQELFYGELAGNRLGSFFGMTEPMHGTDATAMRTRLDADPCTSLRLRGVKHYVANATRGGIGVVFARTGANTLSIRAVLLHRDAPGFACRTLDMLGLRGACIGEMSFDAVPIERDLVLGNHLPASRRGIWGVSRTFNVMRLQIAAQAVGVALAIRDYVCAERPGWDGHELVSARLDAARELVYDCAIEVDQHPDNRQAPSIGKAHTTTLAVEVSRWAESVLGPGCLLANPLLEKWCRDVYAFEFMDGTSNFLRLTIAADEAGRPAEASGR
uniref:Putative acyl-CoA dehydrogenase n=1 Tax=Amycolatopsis sp. SANK 60206 TaxID=1642649 RepID=A0A0E3USN5_9PSEU|nr:putative acyl-CoA dehydrogenase [Amycolatopsis sp. SANK 60206]